jgi:hypothetical protein
LMADAPGCFEILGAHKAMWRPPQNKAVMRPPEDK